MLVTTIDAQWEGMGDVGSARYDHKGFNLQQLVSFQKFSTLRVKYKGDRSFCLRTNDMLHDMWERGGGLAASVWVLSRFEFWVLVSVRTFSVMYDHIPFYVCSSPDHTSFQATCKMACQPGDCRWPLNVPQTPQSRHATTIIEFLLIYSSKMMFEANAT